MATSRPPSPRAGGAILALTILVGAVIGVAMRQPTLGSLAGLAVGVAIALAVWLRDRARDRHG